MLKNAVQQAAASEGPKAYPLGYRGWAGEKSDFFSILLIAGWFEVA